VPACPSSLISALTHQTGPAPGPADPVPSDLLAALAVVPDPRARRGVRHRMVTLLAIAACAVLAGAGTFVAIAEWAGDLPVGVRVRLGLGRVAPSESTIRRTLRAVDIEAFDRAVSDWVLARSAPTPSCGRRARRVIAVDGKSARGARGLDGRAVHLLAAFDQASGAVLGQSVVDGKTNEITAFAPLLDRIELSGAIVTADALHTQTRHAHYLHARGAHYVLTVKDNQPGLRRQLAALPWAGVPAAALTHDKGHGRVETRTLKAVAVRAGIGFPHAQLAVQLTRRTRSTRSRKWHTETVYAVTDLGWGDIGPDELAEIIRGHWGIENRLHWIRDVVFAEDHSQIRTGSGPAVMASLRNLAVSRHRLAGATSIAAACRYVSRHPRRVLRLLT
jgi:predicted transposase YbfD/YdcC